MKKTISVNIKGINFTVEEGAYELLQNYLDRLETTLGSQDGSKEIIEDVELRIAELCNAKLNDSKTVIELKDIEEILETLGDPSEYVDEDEETASHSNESYNWNNSGRKEKQLFRDEENATIAGVCAGIASYFGIDIVIVRVIFVLMLFMGFGFMLYLILWVVVPKAKNTIDRLRMKGRPITVETVRNEVENAADRIKSESRRAARRFQSEGSGKRVVSRGARILTSIIGFGLIGFGLLHLVGFLIVILGGFEFVPVQSSEGFLISLTDFGELFLSNSGDVNLAWIGGLMVVLSFILFFILLGSLLLFRIRNRWGKLSLLGLFVTAIIGGGICLKVGFNTAKDLVVPGEHAKSVGTVHSKELVIIPQSKSDYQNSEIEIKSKGKLGLMELDGDQIIGYGINIDYVSSDDSLFHIKQNFNAQGRSHKKAFEKSENITHGIEISGDTLFMATEYAFPKADKFRFQEVTVIVEVPDSAIVKVENEVVHLGQETTNERVNHRYYKEEGYVCGDGRYYHEHRHY